MIAVIGGGVAGLTAAIRLAEQGKAVHLFEAAPELGGRTRSFFDKTTGQYCDNGPHLMIGAYSATRRLLEDCHAAQNVHWQEHLNLPLWDAERGHFQLRTVPWLPFPLALMLGLIRLPAHQHASALALIKLSRRTSLTSGQTVKEWLEPLNIPPLLQQDMLEPLCLGTMNEYPDTAPAASFRYVLDESFSSHKSACLGWFRLPLSEALIEPLRIKAGKLGVSIHVGNRIRHTQTSASGIQLNAGDMKFQHLIVTTPIWASGQITGLGMQQAEVETRPITNLHLWYDEPVNLGSPSGQPLLGGIGTLGQWFFDISSQMDEHSDLQHIAIVISADPLDCRDSGWMDVVTRELAEISGQPHALHPVHRRVIQERRATVLARSRTHDSARHPAWLIDASEWPQPGELPATIEAAVRRGEQAARMCIMSQK